MYNCVCLIQIYLWYQVHLLWDWLRYLLWCLYGTDPDLRGKSLHNPDHDVCYICVVLIMVLEVCIWCWSSAMSFWYRSWCLWKSVYGSDQNVCVVLIMFMSVWYWSRCLYGTDHVLLSVLYWSRCVILITVSCLCGTDHVCYVCVVLIMSVWYWLCQLYTDQDVCVVLIIYVVMSGTDQDVWYWSRCLCGTDQDICYTCVVLTIMFVHDSTGSLHLKPCLDCTLALNASSSTTVDVCQGCLLSLILFNLFLEKITQETLHDHHVSTPVMEGPYTTYNMLTISISWAAAMVNFKVS